MNATHDEPGCDHDLTVAELRRQLNAAFAREAAVAEVLAVINRSPGDPEPAFRLILERAHGLCGAEVGALGSYDGTHLLALATHGYPSQSEASIRQPFLPSAFHAPLLHGARLHVPDTEAYPWTQAEEGARSYLEQTGMKTLLMVPLQRDGSVVGFISALTPFARQFAEADMSLLESFAAQAVIAMENARLLSEQQEALERQTATAEVLAVINASSGNLMPVFETILEKAMTQSDTASGLIDVFDGGQSNTVCFRGVPNEFMAFRAVADQPGSYPALAK